MKRCFSGILRFLPWMHSVDRCLHCEWKARKRDRELFIRARGRWNNSRSCLVFDVLRTLSPRSGLKLVGFVTWQVLVERKPFCHKKRFRKVVFESLGRGRFHILVRHFKFYSWDSIFFQARMKRSDSSRVFWKSFIRHSASHETFRGSVISALNFRLITRSKWLRNWYRNPFSVEKNRIALRFRQVNHNWKTRKFFELVITKGIFTGPSRVI